MAAKSRQHQESVREIGPPPKVKNRRRRNSCKHDLLKYLKTYHHAAFGLPFSEDHYRLIQCVQDVILDGGCVVVAMPRGSGKTTICQRAEIWAALYGHRQYPCLFAADVHKYETLLDGIKTILETNPILHEDFPEICHPVICLEHIANRANFQMCQGVPTGMKWGSGRVVFPTTKWTEKAGNAGVVIGGGGLTGASVRGAVATLRSGEQRRPDAVLIDDPQTRESARSRAGVTKREDIVSGDILGMAGPGKRMAAMCTATVIYKDDLADRLLDAERSPDWKSIRVQTLKSWPKNMGLWEKYDSIRRQALLGEVDDDEGNKFYQEHREEMDAGAEVYWNERVDPGKLSAIQTAMDEFLRDPRAFMAERQNLPEDEIKSDLEAFNPLLLVRRINQYGRGTIPPDVTTLTCHIDVQQKLLYWTVCGWTQSFRGYVIDYGSYPEQKSSYYALRSVRYTLKSASPGNDDSGALRAGIHSLVTDLTSRPWKRTDGAEMGITRGLVDARYRPEDVEAALIASKSKTFMPAYGVGIGAKDNMLGAFLKKQSVIRGHHWMIYKPAQRNLMAVFVDTNFWKTQTHQSLVVPEEHSSALTLFKAPRSKHQLFVDHLCSEVAVRVEAKGRIVDEWQLPSTQPDNHFWDNLVGCLAAASTTGIRRPTDHVERPRKRGPKKRVKQLAI
jgi:hypothetical protein